MCMLAHPDQRPPIPFRVISVPPFPGAFIIIAPNATVGFSSDSQNE